jgi:hypothetical protein
MGWGRNVTVASVIGILSQSLLDTVRFTLAQKPRIYNQLKKLFTGNS